MIHLLVTCGFQSIITANLIAKPKSNKNPSVYFTVTVTNNSEETVHVKKNSVLRIIHEIDEI